MDIVETEILWTGRPSNLIQKILTLFHLNFTKYVITKDEIIVHRFFKKNSYKLYLLKGLKVTSTVFQRGIGIGNVSVEIEDELGINKVSLINIRKPLDVKKILRDAIEDDIMDRTITYKDKIRL